MEKIKSKTKKIITRSDIVNVPSPEEEKNPMQEASVVLMWMLHGERDEKEYLDLLQ